jgi:hypothetical protein
MNAEADPEKGTAEGGAAGDAAPGAGFVPHLAEAALACMSSGARFWRGIAEVYGRHQATILGSMVDRAKDGQLSANQRLILADDIRSYLRELGDVSLQEARHLQMQLAQIGERVARDAETPDASSEYRRFWKSKP